MHLLQKNNMKAIQKDSNHLINYNKLKAHLWINPTNPTIKISLKTLILHHKCLNKYYKKRRQKKNHNLKESKVWNSKNRTLNCQIKNKINNNNFKKFRRKEYMLILNQKNNQIQALNIKILLAKIFWNLLTIWTFKLWMNHKTKTKSNKNS
jgi:hypothetical protein